MRPKGRSVRRALCAGVIVASLFMALSAAAEANVFQHIPLPDSSFHPSAGVAFNQF